MPRGRCDRCLLVVLLCSLFFVACSEAPDQEIQQAQTAIDAAQAAQAADYAPDELKAAVDALAQARAAAATRDYRQALNQALDSRERAQAAMREAGERKAALRTAAEHLLAAATEAIAKAETRVKAMETRSSRAAPRDGARITAPMMRKSLDHAKARLQEARTAWDAGKFAQAETSARAALAALTPVSGATEAAGEKPSATRRP